ncbi:MAG TPA: PACE efflux transporter [Noviherbaspirillum sp.]|nr:PACE efflux transporter [Noviherbaspirillum sp.]
MQGIKRKIVYVTAYELIAVTVCSGGFVAFSDASLQMAGALSVTTSLIAALWNFVFNMLFEAWESRQARRGRSLLRRLVHAVAFEAVLFAMFVPLIAWWLDVTLLHALAMNTGLAVFFLVYTFVFAWCFDRIFGLPASAQALGSTAPAR